VRIHTDCKHLFAAGEHPLTRISIHRCYKRYRGVAWRGVWKGDSGGPGRPYT